MSTPLSCFSFLTTSGGMYSVVPQIHGLAFPPFGKNIDQLKSHNLAVPC
jgi:hypothetical protein